ncbi:MAG: response regulator transcription factor [Acidobacteriota bacterium]
MRQAVQPVHQLEMLRLDQIGSLPRCTTTHLILSALILDAPPGQSAALIRELCIAEPALPIIVWERTSGSEPALSALGSGVRGIMLDCTTPADALACIQTVVRGGIWVPASVAQAVVASRPCHLTRRESQLVRLVSQGLSNKDIASALGISVGTVKVYFSRLFDKLEVADRYELAMLGLRQAGTVCRENPTAASADTRAFPTTIFLPRINERAADQIPGY